MRTFSIIGGERQVKSFRKDIRKARDTNRNVAIKFFQLKANMLITEIEAKLEGNEPINLDITTHFGGANKSLAPADLVVNVCWGWGKLSYSQVSYPDLMLMIDPSGYWDFHSGSNSFKEITDWKNTHELTIKVYQNIIYDVLKLDSLH